MSSPIFHCGSFQGPAGQANFTSLHNPEVNPDTHMLGRWKPVILGLPLKLRKTHQGIKERDTVHFADNSKAKTQHYHLGMIYFYYDATNP